MKPKQINPLSRFSFKSIIFLAGVSLSALGCGGGGGGGDSSFIGAALTSVSVSPNVIDSGDRALVSSQVGEVHPNGILLKYRFPTALRYVPSSAQLKINRELKDISPQVNEVAESENAVYLVFFLGRNQFTESGEEYDGGFGTVSFELEGISAVREGRVEIDADVDDPAIDNATEFNIGSPEFSAEDRAEIRVTD